MHAVAESFSRVVSREGLAVGVLPGDPQTGEPPPDYPNPFVDIPLRTHLPSRGADGAGAGSRNHIIVLSADVVVALPGGEGTASEAELATRYGVPIIAYLGGREQIPRLPAEVRMTDRLDEVDQYVNLHITWS